MIWPRDQNVSIYCYVVRVDPIYCDVVTMDPIYCYVVTMDPIYCYVVRVDPIYCYVVTMDPIYCHVVTMDPIYCYVVRVYHEMCHIAHVVRVSRDISYQFVVSTSSRITIYCVNSYCLHGQYVSPYIVLVHTGYMVSMSHDVVRWFV